MIKLLVYTDGKPAAVGALRFAVELKKRLAAELAVITVRSGTHATEEPPPVGIDIPLANRQSLPRGLQILVAATDVLADEGLDRLGGDVDAQCAGCKVPALGERRVENDFRRRRDVEPGIRKHLALELAGVPARVTQRNERLVRAPSRGHGVDDVA